MKQILTLILLLPACFARAGIDSLPPEAPGIHTGATFLNGTPGPCKEIRLRCPNSTVSEEPLLVIDGLVKKSNELKELDPNSIKSIYILNKTNAPAIYGSKGKNGVIIVSTKTEYAIQFKITDRQDNSPIDGTTVKVVQDKTSGTIRVVSNKDGIVASAKLRPGYSYTVLLSCIGYDTKIQKLTVENCHQQTVFMLNRKYNKLDSVIVASYANRKISCGMRCYSIRSVRFPAKEAQNDFLFSAYPNPATRGGTVTLKINQPVRGSLQVITISGQVVQSKNINANENAPFNYTLGNLPAGAYFIRLTDEMTNKTVIGKIMVQ